MGSGTRSCEELCNGTPATQGAGAPSEQFLGCEWKRLDPRPPLDPASTVALHASKPCVYQTCGLVSIRGSPYGHYGKERINLNGDYYAVSFTCAGHPKDPTAEKTPLVLFRNRNGAELQFRGKKGWSLAYFEKVRAAASAEFQTRFLCDRNPGLLPAKLPQCRRHFTE